MLGLILGLVLLELIMEFMMCSTIQNIHSGFLSVKVFSDFHSNSWLKSYVKVNVGTCKVNASLFLEGNSKFELFACSLYRLGQEIMALKGWRWT